jgi:hypothetical protein
MITPAAARAFCGIMLERVLTGLLLGSSRGVLND